MLKKLSKLLAITPLLFLSSCASGGKNTNGGNSDNQDFIVDSKGEHVKGNLQVIAYSRDKVKEKYKEQTKNMKSEDIKKLHITEDFFIKSEGQTLSVDWKKQEIVNSRVPYIPTEKNFYLISLSSIINDDNYTYKKSKYGEKDKDISFKNEIEFALCFSPTGPYFYQKYTIKNLDAIGVLYNYETKKYNRYVNIEHAIKDYSNSSSYGGVFNMMRDVLFGLSDISEKDIDNYYMGIAFDKIIVDLSEPA